MVILLVLGNGVAIGGGYNNSNYEDKVVVRAPVDSAWAPKSVVAEANVASVINRLDSQPAVTRPDITPTTILPGILEDVRPARPAVTNKIVYITPDGGARTLTAILAHAPQVLSKSMRTYRGCRWAFL